MSRLAAALLFLPLVFAAPIEAQSVADDPAVEEALDVVRVWLDAQRAYQSIPGLSVAVIQDQELVWSGAFGHAHREERVPATPTTLYSICSISKLFTSVALMQLRDRGLVRLDDPVAEHLGWFTLEQRYEDSPPITVEGILTHSSGLPRESDHPYWSAPDFPFPTREEMIAGLADQETLYPARRYFQYSNLGLTLAGELVQELSGRPYAEYVRANVLEPLGLHDTYTDMPEEHRGGRLATGYGSLTREGTREEQPFYTAKGIAPAAGYASTAEDLARFASWMFRLRGDREEVLHAHTLDEMQRPHYVDPGFQTFRGLGFGISRRNDETFVGHGGSCPGYRTQLVMQRDERIATVVMANAMISTGTLAYGMYDLVAEAIGEAAKDGEDAPRVAAETADGNRSDEEPEVDLTPYLGTYSAQPWGSEEAVVRWKGGLAMMGLPTENPLRALTRLRHVQGHVFRRVLRDGELGEEIVFETEASGRVTGYRQHGNLSPRIR